MIDVQSLSKTFAAPRRGRKSPVPDPRLPTPDSRLIHAVESLTFQCRPGRVYGLLGPNGAGKTTTLRLISTALKPTSGTAVIDGHDVIRDPSAVRAHIGFLSASTGLYPRLTPRELLRYFGRLYGIDGPALESRIGELAATFDLVTYLDRPCDKLSTGMKQRVSIARTVVHDPPVLVLDEPTSGLDILGARDIVDFVRTCRERGKTILFSTHVMREVERLCDDVGIIHKGRLLYTGPLADFAPGEAADRFEDAFLRHITAGESG